VYISRYRDVREVLRKPQIFASRGGFKADGIYIPIGDASLGDFDEPEHGPLRKLAMDAAGPSRVEAERPYAALAARKLVARLSVEGGTADLVASLALPLSSEVIAHLLGAPVEEAGRLFHWAEEIMHSEFPTYLRTSRGVGYHGAFPEYASFVDYLIEERLRRDSPRDDAIKRIVDAIITEDPAADPTATKSLIFMIVSTLLLGGVTTTRDFVGWMFYELISKPDLYRGVAANRELVPIVVEETLRMYPPLLYLMRNCTVDTDINGFAIRAGERVLVGIASANRDDEIYTHADEFRVDRHSTPPHLTFGHGIHLCVGNALARMEGEVLLNEFLDQIDAEDVRLAQGYELELMPVPFMYGPVHVDIETRHQVNG